MLSSFQWGLQMFKLHSLYKYVLTSESYNYAMQDESSLMWLSSSGERTLKLTFVSKIIPGQRRYACLRMFFITFVTRYIHIYHVFLFLILYRLMLIWLFSILWFLFSTEFNPNNEHAVCLKSLDSCYFKSSELWGCSASCWRNSSRFRN